MKIHERPKLLEDIDWSVYNRVMAELLALRLKHPYYRDDQLLVFMLCQEREVSPDATNENVPYAGECDA